MMKKLLLYLLIFVQCYSLFGQYIDLNLKPQSHSFNKYKLIEQIDLNTNQDFYLAGESIWMALHTYDASFNMPVTLSSIVYVEIYTHDHQIVSQQKVQLENGSGMGYIQIPKTLQTNHYYLRAYTNYMKNYGPSYFYRQRLQVINPFYPVFKGDEKENAKSDSSFMVVPEAGKLITGMKNKVVYTAKTGNEYCHEIVGRVVDGSDSVILRTNSTKGIGSFNFEPLPGKKYRFEALACDQRIAVDLPMAEASYNTILLDSLEGNTAYLHVVTTNESLKNLKIQIINNGILYESDYLSEGKSKIQLKLESGISQVQLVTPRDEVLANKYVAVGQEQKINISLESTQTQIPKRKPITLKIKTTDENNHPISCKMNVSVSLDERKESMQSKNKRLQNTHLINVKRLFPDIPLSDFIPFIGDQNLLNDFLITQSSDNYPNQSATASYSLPAELDKDIITGYVVFEGTQERAPNITIYQSFIDSVARLSIAVTDSLGNFLIELPDGFTGKDIVLAIKDTAKNYEINLDSEFSNHFVDITHEPYNPDKSLKDQIQKRMVNLQIQDAYNLKDEFVQSKPSDLRFYGYPDESYNFSDYIDLPNMEEFAFEVVSNATIVRENNAYHIYVLSDRNDNILGNDPLYLVDGVPVFDKDVIPNIPPAKMKNFHIVNNKYYYKSASFDGIIDITSKSGDFSGFELPKNSMRANFVPIQGKVSQVSLDSSFQYKNIPQYQTTLYFDSEVSTNQQGLAEIQFYSPDNKGKYSIIIHGYDDESKTGYAKFPAYFEIVEDQAVLSVPPENGE